MSSLAEDLISFTVRIKWEDLSAEVIQEAKRHIIDSMACAIGAYLAPPSSIIRRLALRSKVSEGATLLGTQDKVLPEAAAFYNGLLVRYFDYNDTYLSLEPAHPSDNLPAVLAAAEYNKSSGKDFILALVLAYEIQCRLCDAGSLRTKGWDHVCYGLFSSALASGKLMGLSEEELKQALALSGVSNLAMRQTRVGELSMWKGCAFAHVAKAGLFAALLAREGMTGPTDVFAGEYGFFNQVSGPLEINFEENQFKIMETHLKYYPCEYHAQSGVEAAIHLHPKIRSFEDIREIRVETFNVAYEIIGKDLEKWRPKSRETADHSLPYCIAVALIDGSLGLEQFNEDRLQDPGVMQLMQKVKIIEKESFSKEYPDKYLTRITISFDHPITLEEEVALPKGHFKNPMTDKEIEEKFNSLAGPYLSSLEQSKILEILWKVDELKDWSRLLNHFFIEEPLKT